LWIYVLFSDPVSESGYTVLHGKLIVTE